MPGRFRVPARRPPLDQTATLGVRDTERTWLQVPAGPCLSFPVRLPTVCRRTICFRFPASLDLSLISHTQPCPPPFTELQNTPSSDTNWPTADEPPPLFSTNCTSDTMMLSSSTEPQPVHTASPRAASNSMSVPPQPRQTRPVMLELRGPAGPPPLSSPLSARGPQPARPFAPPPSVPHSREAAGATPADSSRQIRLARAGRAASNGRARGPNKGTQESLGRWDRTADLPGGRKRSSKPGARRPHRPQANSGAGLAGEREGRGEAVSPARDPRRAVGGA